MNKAYIIAPLVAAVAFLIFPFIIYYGSLIMVVSSDSMLPTLKPYDLIVVERTSIDQIKVGDIVVFETHIEGMDIVAHRAIEVHDDHGEIGVATKGDNVDSPDGWLVQSEDLIGRITNVVPTIGIFIMDPVRYAVVAVIVITAISLMHEVTTKAKAPDQH